ncbi:MAG: glycosyltransferase family 9 protein [Promethearchaeota archaeon]
MIRTDCLYYKGEIPCIFHKKFNVDCNDSCQYYKKIGLRFLIIKKDAIGDVLRTTPILHSIKEKYGKDTHITWLTEKNAFDLLKFNPLIDRVYIFNFKSFLELQVEEFDILLNLDKDKPALALAKIVKAKKKYGFTMNKCGNLITFKETGEYALRLGISDKLKKENLKTYQQIIAELLELPYSKEFKYILNIPNKEALIKTLCGKKGIKRDSLIIGFNTGAGLKFPTKIWPKENFVQLGLKLIREQKATILLFGAQDEKEINEYIYNNIYLNLDNNLKSKIINTGINNTLLEFAALISTCNIFITGDTLGLHLAIALNVQSISFYGPTSSTEIDLYGTGKKIVANSPCLLCYKKECNYTEFCLSKISVSDIYKKILEILKTN